MQPKKITKKSFKIIGMDCLSSEEENENEQDIVDLWEKFRPRIDEIENTVNPDKPLGIFIQNKIYPDRFTYVAGVEVKNIESIPKGMVPKIISNSRYAVFTHQGERQSIGDTYDNIFNEWEENTDHSIDREAERVEKILSEDKIKLYIPLL
ncbi:MAG: GyrI-like domain-containing protein [Bacillota bacterium]